MVKGTRHIPVARKHKFRQMFVDYLGEQIQLYLVEIAKYKNYNKGYYWILTSVEMVTRYAFAITFYRKDTSNMSKAVTELRQFKDRFGEYPKFDGGVKTLLDKCNIKYFFTLTDKKAAVVEILLQQGNQ